MKGNNNVPISFQEIESFNVEDDRFMKVKIWICHINENLNGSYFSKEVVTEAIPSLANTPILAFIEENKDGEVDFSNHRQILVAKNGKFQIKYVGVPIGIIPETNNAQFELRMCDDNVEREFLTVEGLVWQNKWDDPIDIFNRDIIKSQSMEIHTNHEGFWGDDKLYHFTKFSFYGACALGTDILPAMKNSTIEAQVNNFMEEYTKAKFNQFSAFVDNYSITNKKEGGTKLSKTEFSLTYNQLRDELRAFLKTEKKVDEWGYEYNKYWFVDADEMKVYVEDTQDSYRLVSFDYSLSGDNVTVNFESKSRVKITYVPFEENTEEVDVQFASSDRLTYEVDTKEKIVKKEFNEKIEELDRLREFESTTLKKDREIAETEMFEKFSAQLSEDDIKQIKSSSESMSIEDIETQLYAMVGKKNTKFTSQKQKNKDSVRFKLPEPSNNKSTDKPYAHLFQ
ncbi:hypothetical protein [Paenibacillus sp. FSL P4-0502]|uniref:hypothetical protein n=1 Tax=Paenibacillus sp. FSL P4-0502 TaxID=2975319 RepID=UPI0030FCDFAA